MTCRPVERHVSTWDSVKGDLEVVATVELDRLVKLEFTINVTKRELSLYKSSPALKHDRVSSRTDVRNSCRPTTAHKNLARRTVAARRYKLNDRIPLAAIPNLERANP